MFKITISIRDFTHIEMNILFLFYYSAFKFSFQSKYFDKKIEIEHLMNAFILTRFKDYYKCTKKINKIRTEKS